MLTKTQQQPNRKGTSLSKAIVKTPRMKDSYFNLILDEIADDEEDHGNAQNNKICS